MVATAHPLATYTGLKVLEAGGNAIDAAIAIAGTTCVVMPAMCGLGGDVFALVYTAKDESVHAVCSSGVVPNGQSAEHMRQLGYKTMPLSGILSVSVPGAVDAYYMMLERFGTMQIRQLWEDALRYARGGFCVTPVLEANIRDAAQRMSEFDELSGLLMPQGKPLKAGETLCQTDLADSIESIMRDGPDVFYRGEIADKIIQYSRQHGGFFDGSELAEHQAELCDPISTTYRDKYQIYQTPPPSQGHIMLEEMNIIEGFNLKSMSPDSAELVHLLVEAKRLAFSDRNRYMGDPQFVDAPLDALISKSYATKRRLHIDANTTMAEIPEDLPQHDCDTTSFAVVDRWGNAVSFIHSLSMAFGSCVVVPETGIILNNRAGRGFTLADGHPNCIAAGKKTMHTLNAFMVLRDGAPYLVANTPGGDGQPQHNMQMAVSVLDFGMNPQQAADAPRWTHTPGTDPATLDSAATLSIESRFSRSTLEGLRQKGHNLNVIGPWAAGGTYQIIMFDVAKSIYLGGTDPRGEGLAFGL